LAEITLNGRRAGRRAEADGRAAQRGSAPKLTRSWLAAGCPATAGPLPGKLYVAIDETSVPMVPAETADRPEGQMTEQHAPGGEDASGVHLGQPR
jgi:hypothetical protein